MDVQQDKSSQADEGEDFQQTVPASAFQDAQSEPKPVKRSAWAPVQNVLLVSVYVPLLWLGERLAEIRVAPLMGGVAVGVLALAVFAADLPSALLK